VLLDFTAEVVRWNSKPKTLTPLSKFTRVNSARKHSHVNLVDCPRFYSGKQGLFTSVGEKAVPRYAALGRCRRIYLISTGRWWQEFSVNEVKGEGKGKRGVE
jgi:hypothetical protein